MQTVQCPSCGATATNINNCEFCGSLYVRFSILNLDIKRTINENTIYYGLEEKLIEVLNYCKSNQYVNLYIKLGDKQLFQISRSSMVSSYLDELNLNFSCDRPNGIGIVNIFDNNQQVYLSRFMDLDESILFYQSSESDNLFFAIDFGLDYTGAALLSSILLKKVYRINPSVKLDLEVEYWNENGPNNPFLAKGCFIATATMGSYDHPLVVDLRNFRDNWLLKRKWGMKFTNWYYINGKIAAKYIESSSFLRMAILYSFIKPIHMLVKLIFKF